MLRGKEHGVEMETAVESARRGRRARTEANFICLEVFGGDAGWGSNQCWISENTEFLREWIVL